MTQSVRVILFNGDETAAPELRKQLTSLPHVRIVAELDEPSLLPHAVAQFPAELIFAHLDPGPDIVLECLAQLLQASPDVPVLTLSSNTDGGVVLRAMRAGIREYLVKPLTVEDFEQAVTRLVVSQPQGKQRGKLISIMGSAGGVGSSMLAVNLAVELASMVTGEMKTALVDLDFRFGQVATMLDVHGQFTVADLCTTPEQLDPQMIMKALVKHESGVHVLTRPHSFAQAEMITSAHCASVLTALQEIYPYVVVDGPTRHDPGGRTVLDAADYSFMVVQLLVTSVRNTDRMLKELAVEGFNTDRIALICNRLGRESAHLEVAHVEQTLNRKMYLTIPDDWKSVSSSINIGRPLSAEFDRTKVRQAIRQLAMKIHCPEALAESEQGRGGLIGKFFKKGARPQAAAPEAVAATTASAAAV